MEGGGSGYSASGSNSATNEQQQRYDHQFGEVNNATGLQIPGWLWIAAVAGFFLLLIAAALGFIAWQFTKK